MQKTVGDDLQQIDYRYNVRGWLTHINDAILSDKKDIFGLLYFETFHSHIFFKKRNKILKSLTIIYLY